MKNCLWFIGVIKFLFLVNVLYMNEWLNEWMIEWMNVWIDNMFNM